MEAVQQAKDHDPECAYTHFLAFKLALLLNQQEEGKRHLRPSLSLSSSLLHLHLIASLLSSLSSLPPASLPPPSLLPAVQSLQAMSTCSAVEEEDSLGLVSLAAQMAFEVGSSLLLRFLTLPKQKLGP